VVGSRTVSNFIWDGANPRVGVSSVAGYRRRAVRLGLQMLAIVLKTRVRPQRHKGSGLLTTGR
jgi:hypothetical protein